MQTLDFIKTRSPVFWYLRQCCCPAALQQQERRQQLKQVPLAEVMTANNIRGERDICKL